MFIKKIFLKDIAKVNSDKSPMFREKKINWPSEALANVSNGFAVGECQRSLFYKILGQDYTEPGSLRLKKICESGLMYEEQSIKEYKEHGMFIAEQLKIEFKIPNAINDITMSGKMDALIIDDGIFKGVEIKTIDTYKADSIFGEGKLALPAPNNLMQAMMYKYYLNNALVTDSKVKVDEVYLKYINRANGAEMYFLVDIDNDGYAIITPISETAIIGQTIKLKDVKSFDELARCNSNASTDEARLAELRININDIFKKYDSVYNYIEARSLPPKDYELVYSKNRIELEHKVGRLSKIKYNKAIKGEAYGDKKCTYCNYRSKCLKDSGVSKLEL